MSALIASAYRNGHTLVAEHRSDLEMTAERFDLRNVERYTSLRASRRDTFPWEIPSCSASWTW